MTSADPLNDERTEAIRRIREEEREELQELYARVGKRLPDFSKMTPEETGEWYRTHTMRFVGKGGTVEGRPVGVERAARDEVVMKHQLRVNTVMGRGKDGELLKDERRRLWKLNREEEEARDGEV